MLPIGAPMPSAALATVIAAFVGAALTLVGLILSKEQKTSEFRQAWIDGLREDLSEFLSRIEVTSALLAAHQLQSDRAENTFDFIEKQREDLRDAHARYYRIILRLNPREHCELIKNLDEVIGILSSRQAAFNRDQVGQILQALLAQSQVVLKTEWKRVKRGEIPFRVAKYSSLLLLAAVMIYSGYTVYGSYFPLPVCA